MKVELLSCTQDALNLLLQTKNTRLANEDDPAGWSEQKKEEHLAYMRDTIKSSWEFVDYVFRISGVTRAFTHQLVRTRTGSYAQESQRTIDARNSLVVQPELSDELNAGIWGAAVNGCLDAYAQLIDNGEAPQDARGILPTNVTTSIIAKFNLRTLADMAEKRLCTRTQGEYQEVMREMRRLVVDAHPWAEQFINVYCVNHGRCCFPRYGEKECPVWDLSMKYSDTFRAAIVERWENNFYAASPRAVEGKAQ